MVPTLTAPVTPGCPKPSIFSFLPDPVPNITDGFRSFLTDYCQPHEADAVFSSVLESVKQLALALPRLLAEAHISFESFADEILGDQQRRSVIARKRVLASSGAGSAASSSQSSSMLPETVCKRNASIYRFKRMPILMHYDIHRPRTVDRGHPFPAFASSTLAFPRTLSPSFLAHLFLCTFPRRNSSSNSFSLGSFSYLPILSPWGRRTGPQGYAAAERAQLAQAEAAATSSINITLEKGFEESLPEEKEEADEEQLDYATHAEAVLKEAEQLEETQKSVETEAQPPSPSPSIFSSACEPTSVSGSVSTSQSSPSPLQSPLELLSDKTHSSPASSTPPRLSRRSSTLQESLQMASPHSHLQARATSPVSSPSPAPSCMNAQAAKIRCLLHYFLRVAKAGTPPPGSIQITRRALTYAPRWNESTKGLCDIIIDREGLIEDTEPEYYKVDFANRVPGGGVLGQGCVQEEILFTITPELLFSRLFCHDLFHNEALLIEGCERVCKYTGYSSTFQYDGDFEDQPVGPDGLIPSRYIVIDALPYGYGFDANDQSIWNQWSRESINRELNKAFTGFSFVPLGGSLATGHWGCGAFNGDHVLKFLIQWMAATEAGVGCMRYSAMMMDTEFIDPIKPLLRALMPYGSVKMVEEGKESIFPTGNAAKRQRRRDANNRARRKEKLSEKSKRGREQEEEEDDEATWASDSLVDDDATYASDSRVEDDKVEDTELSDSEITASLQQDELASAPVSRPTVRDLYRIILQYSASFYERGRSHHDFPTGAELADFLASFYDENDDF